jgi:hypothetical protein
VGLIVFFRSLLTHVRLCVGEGGIPLVEGMPSRFLVLQNMFNPATYVSPIWSQKKIIFLNKKKSCCSETEWDADIRDEVLEECAKHGAVHHIKVDMASPGWVFLKFQLDGAAIATKNVMHGRFFDGQMITVRFLTEAEYNARFPEAAAAVTPLRPA